MTDDQLKQIEARQLQSQMAIYSRENVADVIKVTIDIDIPEMVAEVRRLRSLVKTAEHANIENIQGSDGYVERYPLCPWCGNDQHAEDCQAFTPDGQVK